MRPVLGDRVRVVGQSLRRRDRGAGSGAGATGCRSAQRRPAAYSSHAGAGGDRRRRGWRGGGRGRARRPRIWRRTWRSCRCWRGRSGCATFPARSWWISPDCRPAGASRWRLPCTPRWRRIRCVRGCSASPLSAWPKSSGRACIRRCTNCSPDRTPRGWRRCVASRPRLRRRRIGCLRCGRRPRSWRRFRAMPRRWRILRAVRGVRLITALGSQPAGNGMDDRGERWLSAGERNPPVRSAASPRRRAAAPVLQPAVRRCRSGPLADRSVSDPGCARRCGGRLTSRANLIGGMA